MRVRGCTNRRWMSSCNFLFKEILVQDRFNSRHLATFVFSELDFTFYLWWCSITCFVWYRVLLSLRVDGAEREAIGVVFFTASAVFVISLFCKKVRMTARWSRFESQCLVCSAHSTRDARLLLSTFWRGFWKTRSRLSIWNTQRFSSPVHSFNKREIISQPAN